ncbi:lipocalin family protein [Maribellus maritimus]|uniref:lipocalin family protein n=1 Tax=Maribellus maritimus TaxID=2870838 RepID=UPI001EE9DCA1|nr:lipocalin family protein [Maribellus maritimus]MCG6189556.1 lipocalin family protein [Maribellus maritimus]
MKRNLFFLCLSLLFVACSTTKQVRTAQKGLKGDWTLSSVTTDKGNIVSIKTLFNQASPDCFEGSSWSFVSNNNSGTYNFEGANCDNSTHSIKWFMEENDDEVFFLWKFIPEGMKPKDVTAGYKLKLLSESETEFVLAQDASFEGNMMTIYYQFVKSQY